MCTNSQHGKGCNNHHYVNPGQCKELMNSHLLSYRPTEKKQENQWPVLVHKLTDWVRDQVLCNNCNNNRYHVNP